MHDLVQQAGGILEIVWVNLILSGDNAVVIALACRGLPAQQRRTGMVLGAGVAVLLRIVFTVLVTALLATPFVKIVGGCLLLWIAVKLTGGEEPSDDSIAASGRLWVAVRTIAIADAVMSLDNVLAIAAVAKGSVFLLVLGLVISMPIIMAGATLITTLLDRFPVLLWAGGALLGWVAGEMLITDPWLVERFGAARIEALTLPAAVVGAVLVLLCGLALRHWRRPRIELP